MIGSGSLKQHSVVLGNSPLVVGVVPLVGGGGVSVVVDVDVDEDKNE